MQHCLSKDELDMLIDNEWKLQDDDTDDFVFRVNQCKYWESELVLFSYFLSQLLERKSKANVDCKNVLENTFQKTSEMWITIQQFDAKFIKYLFRYTRDRDVSLENGLIEIQQNLGQHIYE